MERLWQTKGLTKKYLRRAWLIMLKICIAAPLMRGYPESKVFQAVAYAVKDVIIDEWIATHKEYERRM